LHALLAASSVGRLSRENEAAKLQAAIDLCSHAFRSHAIGATCVAAAKVAWPRFFALADAVDLQNNITKTEVPFRPPILQVFLTPFHRFYISDQKRSER
jgi:hypothetical protein